MHKFGLLVETIEVDMSELTETDCDGKTYIYWKVDVKDRSDIGICKRFH